MINHKIEKNMPSVNKTTGLPDNDTQQESTTQSYKCYTRDISTKDS